MDITSLIGVIGVFVCIIASIFMSEGGEIMNFVDPASIFIVVGGVIFSTVFSFPMSQLKALGTVIGKAFKKKEVDLQADIDMIINVANVARREGLLALEDAIQEVDNPFFQKGVMLMVDGADPELIKNIMEAEIYFVQDRHAQGQGVLLQMSAYSPAFGMIGTLIGLINMLKNLDDMGGLGESMSVALVTTFYGTILANAVFTPMARKLKAQTAAECMEKELLLEGLLSIQDGENPRIIKDKLQAFIARKDIRDESEGGGRAESGEIPS